MSLMWMPAMVVRGAASLAPERPGRGVGQVLLLFGAGGGAMSAGGWGAVGSAGPDDLRAAFSSFLRFSASSRWRFSNE